MAVKDVRKYYYTMYKQKEQMVKVLEEFNKAFEEGKVTEDQLENIKEQVNVISNNFTRVSYIISLLEMPNRDEKKEKYKKANKSILQGFAKLKATEADVVDENRSALDVIRAELKELTKTEDNEEESKQN